jgi:HD-GYP domain-containing protein (c-di-GMP phosphodiesterase class II)
MPTEEAQQEIKRCTGTQFDQVVANAFLKTDISRPKFEKDQVAIINM